MKTLGVMLALGTAAWLFYSTGLSDWAATASPDDLAKLVRDVRGGSADPTPASGKPVSDIAGQLDDAAASPVPASSAARPEAPASERMVAGALDIADRIIRFHTEQVK